MRKIILSAIILACPVCAVSAAGTVKDSLDFDRLGSLSPSDIIRGKMSGVRVSGSDGGVCGSLNTAIRPAGVLRSGNEPLWIIDGAVLSSSASRNIDAFWQESYENNHYTSERNPLDFLNPYDIESIEIIKDASAAALYGSKGANGVILITTKSARAQGTQLDFSSNIGINTGPYIGIVHNHNISISGRQGGNFYRVSGFFRSNEGNICRDRVSGGGLNVNLDARANKTIWFGLKSIISIGNSNAQSSTAWYGHESATQLLGKTGSADSYVRDYDDNSRNYRTVNTAYLRINFLQNFNWQTDFGIDFQHDTRYVWYGRETQFGASYNGAAAILTSSLLQYNLLSKLNYALHAGAHSISAVAGVELYGNTDKLSTMNGADFFNHELRSKGLKFNGMKPSLREYDDNLSHLGILANVKYDYGAYAGASLSFRADNARRFDDGVFSLYPAADAWFDVHRFFRENKTVSTLKIVGGYGKVGKDSYCPYEMFGQYAPGLVVPELVEGTESLYSGLARTRVGEWHMGGEFGFVSDRITLGLTWYDKTVEDSFSWYCFGYDSGKNDRWKPGGRKEVGKLSRTLEGRGLELEIGAQIINTRDVRWTAGINLTRERTEACEFSEIELKLFPSLFGGFNSRLSVGRTVVDIALDGSAGNEVLNMNRMMDEGAVRADRKYVEKADFFRVGKVGVSYNIPIRAEWLKEFRVYAEGLNLAIFSPYSGNNPDVDSYSKLPFCRGADYAAFPFRRTIMAGVKFKF